MGHRPNAVLGGTHVGPYMAAAQLAPPDAATPLDRGRLG